MIRLFVITEVSFPEKASTAIVEEEEELDDKKGLLGKEVFGHEVSWPTRRKWLRDICLWDTSKSQEEMEKCYGRFHKLRYVMLPEGRTWPELLQDLLK